MRTKTLLLTAALGAAGVATSVAQSVFSVNAVGYVNVDVPKGFSMIANPLDAGAGNNTVAKLFAGVPDGTTVFQYSPASGWAGNTLDLGEWGNPNAVLAPGGGAFIRVPSATKVTFVGEVMQGNLSNPIAAGFSVMSSQVPQSGKLDTDLKFPAADGDVVYQFDNATNSYVSHTLDFGEWSNGTPTPKVGEAFFVKASKAGTWTRTFSVNN
jgi:hypothetical protein